MGREANCQCRWAAESAPCKVLLETNELIVRGPIRRRAPISSLTDVLVQGDQLHFRAGADEVALKLGANLAQSWAKKLTTQPPSLATKLGISHDTHLLLIGEFESGELKSAIAAGGTHGRSANSVNLILALVRTITDLNYTLDIYSTQHTNPPIWIIYPKGPKKPMSESEIRGTLRHQGFIDTKVASVSTTLTALRFIKRS
jgi:hypothetical protein